VLNEHRLADGTPTLPGTAYPELAAEALAAERASGTFEIRDLFIMRPLTVADGREETLRLRLTSSDEGYVFSAQSPVTLDGREGYQTHAQGRLALRAMPRPSPIHLGAIAGRCPNIRAENEAAGVSMAQEAHLDFGPRWRVVNAMRFGSGEGLARLSLPESFRSDLAAGFQLHPALMDMATGWAMDLIPGYEAQALWVPVFYRALRVYAPLPGEITSWVRLTEGSTAEGFASFDITITTLDGTVCAEAEGFSIRRLADMQALGEVAPPRRSEVEFRDTAGAAGPDTPVVRRFRQMLAQGIGSGEGAQAFFRALAVHQADGHADPVVTSLDLEDLIQAADMAEAEADTPAGRAGRPETGADYRAPETDIERTLAGFWEELLGIDGIGVDDSFFDLGGHSLIAVRLFARIRKTYNVDLPISALFEAPTIATSAETIAAHVGPRSETNTGTEVAEETRGETRTPARRFTHLVPMHEGQGGAENPIFLVAGMFGNVLNLRHLAHLMGSDRRFYGLQARGLYGGDMPHTRFEEAAADYIAELRQVQPEGPYILGGFSGGGLIAWEMAHQLTRAGEEVAHVALLDTPMPVRPYLSKRDKLIIHRQELMAEGPRYLFRWARDRVQWEIDKILRKLAPPPEVTQAAEFHNDTIEAAFMTSSHAYKLAPWDGSVTLFRPPLPKRWQVSEGKWVSPELRYITEDNGWAEWAPGLDVVEVSGDHDSMVLEPHVRVLARAMRRVIEAAEARQRKPGQTGPELVVISTAAE
jgi:thioesterase domain-containing protein/acyl carrier protein